MQSMITFESLNLWSVFAGFAVAMKNWLRITFATEPLSLEDGLGRIKAFCQRHTKNQ